MGEGPFIGKGRPRIFTRPLDPRDGNDWAEVGGVISVEMNVEPIPLIVAEAEKITAEEARRRRDG